MINTMDFYDLMNKGNKELLLTRLAKIDPDYVSGDPSVVFDGETTATAKTYKIIGNYAPTPNERVVMLAVGNKWVVMGPIGAASLNDYLPLSGGTMTGPLTLASPDYGEHLKLERGALNADITVTVNDELRLRWNGTEELSIGSGYVHVEGELINGNAPEVVISMGNGFTGSFAARRVGGIIHLRGNPGGTPTTVGAVFAVLPVGFRPPDNCKFMVGGSATSNTSTRLISIQADGSMILNSYDGGSSMWLTGVSFIAA